jgi:hypothetical protein
MEHDAGSRNTKSRKAQEFGLGSHPEVAWSDGKELCQRPKVLVLVTEEDLHGLEALGLT